MLNHLWKRSLCLVCLGLGGALLVPACSDETSSAPPPTPDAGAVACELGTSGCACDPVTGCRLGLLCISRRCLPTEGGEGGVPNDSDVPELPGYGGSGPTLGDDDAGAAPPADASADAAPTDSGATLDAGDGG